jgi:hypothetical protein
MLFVDGDRRIVAGTLAGEIGKRFSQSKLLDRASGGAASHRARVGRRAALSLVVVPLLAPQAVAWIAAGIRIDDSMAQEIRHLTGSTSPFSLARTRANGKPAPARCLGRRETELARDLGANKYSSTGSDGNDEYGDEMITRGDQSRAAGR